MTARYYKGREVLKEYKQGRLVYEKQSSIPDYLCFTALESGTFTLTIPAAVTPTYLSYVEYSLDGRNWQHTDNTSEAVTVTTPQVAAGGKVYWRGSGKRMSYSGNSGYTSGFSSTGAFSISGHLVSILKGSDFEDIDFLGATFARLFQDCSNLTSAEELILPSFTVASVFSSMFLRCTALVSAPELPPVTTLTAGCYYQMFFGCTSLTYVKCLATDISATNCLSNWLSGVSSTGTFIKDDNTTWPTGASGIPSGWIVNPDWLCFTALDDNTKFTFTRCISLPQSSLPSISYSLDGGDTWTEVQMPTEGDAAEVTTPAVNAGGKVLWKANAARLSSSPTAYSNFTSTGRFNVSGNIMSLLYGDNHYGQTDTRAYVYSFGSLFRDNTNLIDASQLKLPTGKLNTADLLGLFRGCTNLVHGAPLYAPNINASTCYWMYYGCSSMTEMPTIAATTMLNDDGTTPANYGLYYAFYGCSNMEGEVRLNIVGDVGQQVLDACFMNCSKITSADLAFNGSLGKTAFRAAFRNCSSLNHVKCLATSFYDDGTAANGSLYNWCLGVSSTGTFIQASGVEWPRGASGIPNNWTIQTEST